MMNVKSVQKMIGRLLVEGRHAVKHFPRTIIQSLRLRVFPLKPRHVFTRSGRLRLRYVAILLASFLGLASADVSFKPDYDLHFNMAQAGIATSVHVAEAPQKIIPQKEIVFAPIVPPEKPVWEKTATAEYSRVVTVAPGDTLSNVMERGASIGYQQSLQAIKALRPHVDPKSLRVGENITMYYKWSAAGERWAGAEFAPDALTRVVLKPQTHGGYKVEKQKKELKSETRAVRTTIKSSLSADLQNAGVPLSIITQLIKNYSFSVDFQRDIWAGDTVELLYDVKRTSDDAYVRGETLKYARLVTRGKPRIVYRFDYDGRSAYFDENASPVKKALLRTPVDGARMTSGFGMRKHPIQGYNKMHKGVDFGASTGTPIFAAGDGVVDRAGWVGGYGKYVRIRHGNTYSTAYAHMSRIKVQKGQRVKQGQVIGNVGSTGNSTGPHLHFEVLKAGRQINPVKAANLSIGDKLGGKRLKNFRIVKANADKSFEKLVGAAAQLKLASAGKN